MQASLSNDLLRGAKAAAGYLGLGQRAVYHMTESGQLPVVRKGRTLYYRKSELDRAFASNDQ